MAYWFANLIVDYFLFMIITCLIFGELFPAKLVYIEHAWRQLVKILASFGLSIITFTYLVQFFFKSASDAIKHIALWSALLGLIVPLVIYQAAANLSESSFAQSTVRYILLINPFVNFLESLLLLVFE